MWLSALHNVRAAALDARFPVSHSLVSRGTAVVELRFKTPHKLKHIFVDPTGYHMLISAVSSSGAIAMYAHKDKAEAKELQRLKVCIPGAASQR